MSVDVACLGQPFLDLHFEGLTELPAAGQERTGTGLRVTAGGAATIAIACRRLQLGTVLVAERPSDPAGTLLQGMVAREGVRWEGPSSARCAVTVTTPVGGDRAMITYDPGTGRGLADAVALEPRVAIADLTQVAEPTDVPVFAVVGDEDAESLAGGRWHPHADSCRALIANDREALALTGCEEVEAAVRAIAERAEVAVVTLAGSGAIAVAGGELVRAPAPEVSIADATGAGDLFVASYVWGELRGLDLSARLSLACAYASLSLRDGIAAEAALTEEGLLRAATSLGMTTPRQLADEGDTIDQEEVRP